MIIIAVKKEPIKISIIYDSRVARYNKEIDKLII